MQATITITSNDLVQATITIQHTLVHMENNDRLALLSTIKVRHVQWLTYMHQIVAKENIYASNIFATMKEKLNLFQNCHES